MHAAIEKDLHKRSSQRDVRTEEPKEKEKPWWKFW
jgi:hypothetical protein